MLITEASNYITHQHNTLSGWLYGNLCMIYKSLNGTCASTIGPQQENQVHVPIELYWPEGQLNMIEKIDQMQSSLSDMQNKVDTIEGKVDALSTDMQIKVDTVESKVDAVQDELKEMKDMMSELIRVMAN